MPQRVAEVRGVVATSVATKLLLFPPETFLVPQALPEAAVAVAGRQTMHPPLAILLVDTIPIHPARKCQGGDHWGGDFGRGLLDRPVSVARFIFG